MGKNKLFSELDQAKKEMQHAAGARRTRLLVKRKRRSARQRAAQEAQKAQKWTA